MTAENRIFPKVGGEVADKVTDKEMDMIVRMFAEYRRLGFDEEMSRQLAVRVGMKVILSSRTKNKGS